MENIFKIMAGWNNVSISGVIVTYIEFMLLAIFFNVHSLILRAKLPPRHKKSYYLFFVCMYVVTGF